MNLRFQHYEYIGSRLGEYIPEICVEPSLTDPDEYYVQGWEGFFNTIGTTTITIGTTTITIGTTTITKDIRVSEYHILITPTSSMIIHSPLQRHYEVTLNATHLKPCFKIKYSHILSELIGEEGTTTLVNIHISRSRGQAILMIGNTCKSIVIA